MDVITGATALNLFGKLIYNVLYKWVLTWGADFKYVGAFAVTVIVFTLFLKLITFPFDFWQKIITRKNARIMDEMKPALEKLNKAYANDKNQLMLEQRKLYKQYNYKTFGACLPMILTIVIFFVVFGGFNSAIRHHNSAVYEEVYKVYSAEKAAETERVIKEGGEEAYIDRYPEIVRRAAEKAADVYKPERFLFTTNIFMPDTWASPIPTAADFNGSTIGKLNIPADKVEYENAMSVVTERYNVNEKGKKVWNGYLILPILSFLLSILTSKLMRPGDQPQVAGQTEQQRQAAASQAKMMQYMMPLMMGVFALFYSTAFTLYLFVNSAFTAIFNLVYNAIAKKKDEEAKDRYLSTTIK